MSTVYTAPDTFILEISMYEIFDWQLTVEAWMYLVSTRMLLGWFD